VTKNVEFATFKQTVMITIVLLTSHHRKFTRPKYRVKLDLG